MQIIKRIKSLFGLQPAAVVTAPIGTPEEKPAAVPPTEPDNPEEKRVAAPLAEPAEASGIFFGSMKMWRANSDIIEAMEFCATIQMRTPLRVLRRHGEIHREIDREPPHIAKEGWEGIWLPVTVTLYDDDGTPIEAFRGSSMASDIGPIPLDGGEYLPFLIELRTVVEADGSIDDRLATLRMLLSRPEHKNLVAAHHGEESIISEFFPLFVWGVAPKTAVPTLIGLGLTTANKLVAASDKTLFEIKGIGPAALRKLRERCDAAGTNRDCERVDDVMR